MAVPVTRVQLLPRSVVLYSPPWPAAGPPHPLNTPAYHVFCSESSGSTTTSLVQYFIPGSERSVHLFDAGSYKNTPELAVKPAGPLLPE